MGSTRDPYGVDAGIPRIMSSYAESGEMICPVFESLFVSGSVEFAVTEPLSQVLRTCLFSGGGRRDGSTCTLLSRISRSS